MTILRNRHALGVVLATCAFSFGCGAAEESLDADVLARCGERGAPVTLAKLVEVFRANGITLDINQRRCEHPDATDSDATNFGPSSIERDKQVARTEGDVLCDVGVMSDSVGRKIEVVKYDGDEETNLRVLNVQCSVYPYDAESETAQVGRVRDALEELVTETS